jgi:hypothetical protein
MIEITYIDLALLIWAALATSAYLNSKAELGAAKRFIHTMMMDEKFRNEVIEHFKDEAARAAETQ